MISLIKLTVLNWMKIEIHVTETEFLSEVKTQTPWFQFKTKNKNKKNA